MTPQMSWTTGNNLQAELDRLTYWAYLLTLEPGVAVSMVMPAIDWSLEEITSDPDLLQPTVELALEQSCRESGPGWDSESSPFDAALYGYSATLNSPAFESLKDLTGNPILLLDSTSRIALVLHLVVGYKIREAARMAHMEEAEYRSELQRAYVQLEARNLAGNVLVECAQA